MIEMNYLREHVDRRYREETDLDNPSSPVIAAVSAFPFSYTPHSCSADLQAHTEPDYWAFKSLAVTSSRPSYKDRLSKSNHRSVSFGDVPFTGGSGLFPERFRPQRLSVPVAGTNTCTVDELDLPLVDDIFTTPHTTSELKYSSMLLPDLQNKTKLESCKNASRGWLEVSIDSTMPSSPVLRKEPFDFSSLQTKLPKPSNSLKAAVIPKSSPPPLASSDSSILTKLMPPPTEEMYSRKVFIGGLPPDIDQEEIRISFQKYGSVTIDWPHKIHSKSRVPPKGYAFLLFKDEPSVHKLLSSCVAESDKLFAFIKYNCLGSSITRKKCQIRPWKISDSYYFADEDKNVDSRKAVFVGGVPRPLKASELAEVMNEKFGLVSFVAIDCDSDLKYPKGAACVVFQSHASYIAAVSSRFMQLVFGSIEKKVYMIRMINYVDFINADRLKLSRTFLKIRCAMNAKVYRQMVNLHLFSVEASPA
jgi:RNA recognition motif-containing protein